MTVRIHCSLTFNRSLVNTLVIMPSVLLVSFLWADTTMMMTSNSGQCDAGATCTPMESVPSGRTPASHRTKPPYRLRHAEPEPIRAIVVSSPGKLSRTP